MRTVTLPSGEGVPALGQGTWFMGERAGTRTAEADALRLGLDLGMSLIDTAEMYADGGAEEVVGAAMKGRRDDVFLVSKFYPQNASRSRVSAACEHSLKRLGTDRIDLYLLHWRGSVPLAETVAACEALKAAGKIRYWGVSNLDLDDMDELRAVAHGEACATDQVLYHLGARGIEFDLLPDCQRRGLPVMAYSPLGQRSILGVPALTKVAGRHGVTPAVVALAWVLRQPGVVAIPKAAHAAHVRDNRSAADLQLTQDDMSELDKAFPPPRRKQALAML
ncbi:MAG: aldo/keto reductase [Hyphomicrobiaceae bacterium]